MKKKMKKKNAENAENKNINYKVKKHYGIRNKKIQ
jgi:hypothetical protein